MNTIDDYTFISYFKSFYPNILPFVLFVLCFLLFKQPPKKIAYFHLATVVFIVIFKHFASFFQTMLRAEQANVNLDEYFMFYDYLAHSVLFALFAVFILSLLHRHGVGYDTLLKKEIWGVWHQENNSNDYFEARERKLNAQGVKDNEQ